MSFPRHPFNRGFDWHPIEGPFRRLDPARADLYNEQGWFVIEDAIDPGALEQVVAEIDPFEAMREAWLREKEGGREFISRAGELTFTIHLVTLSKMLREFVRSEIFRDVAHDVLGPDVRLYWDQAVYKKPGTTDGFPWHQDNGYTFTEPQQYLTCWLALSDATLNNGCPELAPGLHREGTLEHEATELGFRCLPDEFRGTLAPLRAGSMVVFSSLTPHRTGPNTSGDVRKAYIVQFAPDGAEHLFPDGEGGTARVPAAVPERQFPILAGGRPCTEA